MSKVNGRGKNPHQTTSHSTEPEKVENEIQKIYVYYVRLYTYIMPPFNFVDHRMSIHNTVEIDIRTLSYDIRIQRLAQPHLCIWNIY